MGASQEAWLILRTFAALLAVTALAYLVLRFGLPLFLRYRPGGKARRLQVDEFLALDRNHRLYIVRWEDSQLLLATSPNRVQLLQARPPDQQATFKKILQEQKRAAPVEGDFEE